MCVLSDQCLEVAVRIRDAADVSAARQVGCAGAVLGKSLLDGRLLLEEALQC